MNTTVASWPNAETVHAYQSLRLSWAALDLVGRYAGRSDEALSQELYARYRIEYPGVQWTAVARALRERH